MIYQQIQSMSKLEQRKIRHTEQIAMWGFIGDFFVVVIYQWFLGLSEMRDMKLIDIIIRTSLQIIQKYKLRITNCVWCGMLYYNYNYIKWICLNYNEKKGK